MLVGEKKARCLLSNFCVKKTNKQQKNLLETRLNVRYETLKVGQKGNK